MTRLLFDTTFLIDLERGRVDPVEVLLDEDDAAVPAIAIAELEVGVRLASDRHRTFRRDFLERVVEAMPIVPYDLEVAREHGRLLAHVRSLGQPRGHHDLMVAATAAATGRSVVSSDERAFVDLPGVAVLGT